MKDEKVISKYRKNPWLPHLRSPVLSIYYNGYTDEEMPFSIRGELVNTELECVSFAEKEFLTTPNRLENMLLSLVTSTDFNKIQDITKIRRGRYLVNTDKFNKKLVKVLFNHILNSKKKRISKTWLPFLQSFLLSDKKENKSERRKKGNKEAVKAFSGKVLKWKTVPLEPPKKRSVPREPEPQQMPDPLVGVEIGGTVPSTNQIPPEYIPSYTYRGANNSINFMETFNDILMNYGEGESKKK